MLVIMLPMRPAGASRLNRSGDCPLSWPLGYVRAIPAITVPTKTMGAAAEQTKRNLSGRPP